MDFFLTTYPLSVTFFLLLLMSSFIYLLTNLVWTSIILFLLTTGCIDLSPLFKYSDSVVSYIFRDSIALLKKNIRESFPVNGKTDPTKQLIYMFHPHGSFSISHGFHIVSEMTNWPRRDIVAVIHHWLLVTPLFLKLFTNKIVGSQYDDIKSVLKEGKSLSICVGGSAEGRYDSPDSMSVMIKKRRGMFKLAIEHGVPIVPVLSYGENMNLDLSRFFTTCERWGKIYKGVLDTKIETHIGEEIDVGEAREPTELDILTVKQKYIDALRELYNKTHPSYYKDEIEII
jgi:hypothetical protein